MGKLFFSSYVCRLTRKGDDDVQSINSDNILLFQHFIIVLRFRSSDLKNVLTTIQNGHQKEDQH